MGEQYRSWPLLDNSEIDTFLENLLLRCERERVAITGGLALCFYAKKHLPFYGRSFNDIDIVARELNAVSTTILSRCWIGYANKEYLALVNKYLPGFYKVDVFIDAFPESDEVETIQFRGLNVQIVTLERLLAHIIIDCWGTTINNVDPKQFKDVETFLGFADPRKLALSWERHFQNKTEGLSYLGAWDEALEVRKEQRERVVSRPFARGVPTILGRIMRFGAKTLWMQTTRADKW